MGFYGSFNDAKNAHGVEEGGPTGRNTPTSPVRDGTSSPGGAANGTAANAVQMVGRLRHGINTPRTRTNELTRKYPQSA